MASDLKDKVDLNAEVIRGVKYRVIRDALLRLGENFHQDVLAVFVWQDKIGGAYQRETGSCGPARLQDLFRFDEAVDDGSSWIARYPKTIAAIRSVRRKGATLARVLAEQGFIERYVFTRRLGGEKRWQITDRGSTLRSQKLLKRIPRTTGLRYLPGIIKAAEDFNAEPGPNYYITRVYVFGSLLRPSPDVGDIDVVVSVAKRFSTDDFDQWIAREKQRMRTIRPSGVNWMIVSTEWEPLRRIQKISPFISTVGAEMLKRLEEKGEPYQVIYTFMASNGTGEEKAAYERDAKASAEFLRQIGAQ